MDELRALVEELTGEFKTVRQELHRIPELAFGEEKTAAYVERRLRSLGLPVRTAIAKYGLVGRLNLPEPGPVLLLRADMDALPIQEETGLPYASQHSGVMHACGHDGHMAMALGAAMVLRRLEHRLRGAILFLFQPAEEGIGGARSIIEAGVMDDPKVDYCLGCHLWPDQAEGTVGVKAGALMAAMDRFHLTIYGRGGHGALPHLCVDALETATQVVAALQRIVSRQMDPFAPTVVTVGSFHAGTTFNVIPGEAALSGTLRTFDQAIWESWPERLEQVIRGVCESMGARHKLEFIRGNPPLRNDPQMADLVRRCAGPTVGPDRVTEAQLTMCGEDMAYILERARGCFFFVGVGRNGCVPLHNPRFDFNENMLAVGVETFCRAALEILGR